MSLTLFELGDQLRQFERIADSDELPEEVLRDTLEAITGSFEVKAAAVSKFILNLEANADAIAATARRQAERAARVQKRADSLKAYILFVLQAAQIKRVETDEIVIRRQANPSAVVVTDESAIPDKYWRQPEPAPKVIDKKLLKADIDAGVQVDGAYISTGEHVRISL